MAGGGCVAVPRRLLDAAADELIRDDRLDSAIRPAGSCLVPTDLNRVDLEEEVPTSEALAVVPPAVARQARVLPLSYRDGVLELAFADASDLDRQIRDLWLGPLVTVRQVLAPTDAVERALDRLRWPEQVDVGFAVQDFGTGP